MKEIVIKISDEVYKYLEKRIKFGMATEMDEIVWDGKVLPKGHGRISDMDEAIKCIEECKGEDAVYAIALIEWACGKRTLLEADKENDK